MTERTLTLQEQASGRAGLAGQQRQLRLWFPLSPQPLTLTAAEAAVVQVNWALSVALAREPGYPQHSQDRLEFSMYTLLNPEGVNLRSRSSIKIK